MASIKVNFRHPTDGHVITVTLDAAMTASEAIAELVTNNFINANPQGYLLAIKGGAELRPDQTFSDAGVKEGDTLNVIPATDAGYTWGHVVIDPRVS